MPKITRSKRKPISSRGRSNRKPANFLKRTSFRSAVAVVSVVLIGAGLYAYSNRNDSAHAASAKLIQESCAVIKHPVFQKCWYYYLSGDCGWIDGNILYKRNGYPNPGWTETLEDTDQAMRVWDYATCNSGVGPNGKGYYESDFQFYVGTVANPGSNFIYHPNGYAYHNQTVYPSDYGHQTTDPNQMSGVSAVLNSTFGTTRHMVTHVTIGCLSICHN